MDNLSKKNPIIEKIFSKPLNNFVIEASAGTGKTYTIIEMVMKLILSGVPIEKILVVTFTEKATQELKIRVKTGIESFLQSTSGNKKELFEKAILNFDQTQIFTIHGFSKRVLDENPFINNQLFERELIDQNEIFNNLFNDVLRNFYSVEEPYKSMLSSWLKSKSLDVLKSKLYNLSDSKGEILGDGFNLEKMEKLFSKLKILIEQENFILKTNEIYEKTNINKSGFGFDKREGFL